MNSWKVSSFFVSLSTRWFSWAFQFIILPLLWWWSWWLVFQWRWYFSFKCYTFSVYIPWILVVMSKILFQSIGSLFKCCANFFNDIFGNDGDDDDGINIYHEIYRLNACYDNSIKKTVMIVYVFVYDNLWTVFSFFLLFRNCSSFFSPENGNKSHHFSSSFGKIVGFSLQWYGTCLPF